MEVEIDYNPESEIFQCVADFLSKVTIKALGNHKYLVKFDGNLTQYHFKLTLTELIAYFCYMWKMWQMEIDAKEEQLKQAKKEEKYVS